jgi:hypothetical protein
MSAEYRKFMTDHAKVRIIQWVAANPQWTPEDMVVVCKYWIKHYGLKNRYLPPDFKREEEKNDADRIEAKDGGQAQPG